MEKITGEDAKVLRELCLKYHITYLPISPLASLVLCYAKSDNRRDSEILLSIKAKLDD